MSEKIVLIDGHSILNRAFYGLPDLTNSKGQHTNAVLGFVNIVMKVIEEEQPTHFAVALKYEPNAGKAPVVIAKGADYLAFQIKDKAKEYNIAIVENKPLARILYHNINVGMEIPPELYQAVAEILATVMRTNNRL